VVFFLFATLNDPLIVSVEDSYGCKRSISVPGISVNVRRVKVSVSVCNPYMVFQPLTFF
jgi:hypothetical protein